MGNVVKNIVVVAVVDTCTVADTGRGGGEPQFLPEYILFAKIRGAGPPSPSPRSATDVQ